MISIAKLVKLLNLEYKQLFDNEIDMFIIKDNIIYYKHEILATKEFIKIKEREIRNHIRLHTNFIISNKMIYNCLINFLWINRVAINKEIRLV